MNISAIFSPVNLRLIELIAEQELGIRELADAAGCSPGKAHQAITMFKKHGIVHLKKQRNKIIIQPARENMIYQKISSLMNLTKIISSKNFIHLKKLGAVGVYGSFAKGTDDSQSDVDLLLVTKEKELKIRGIIRELEQEIGKRINPLVISKEGLKNLETKDPAFFLRLKHTATAIHGDLFG